MTTSPISRGTRGRGALLLADISGYTGFLHDVAEAHRALIVEADEPPPAYALLSGLLDAMVGVVAPPFRLVKFEGDAVFCVADSPAAEVRGARVIECLEACHAAFLGVLGQAGSLWTCTCAACSRIGELGLKFVLHHGEYVAQSILGREELAGPAVILAHRLLKNHARDVVGPRPYVLLTEAAVRELDVPSDGMIAATESYEDLPPVGVRILPLS
jgi:hypothetical protein